MKNAKKFLSTGVALAIALFTSVQMTAETEYDQKLQDELNTFAFAVRGNESKLETTLITCVSNLQSRVKILETEISLLKNTLKMQSFKK